MRIFLGVPFHSDHLAQLQEQLRVEGYSANPQLHATLKFFGEISSENVEHIHATLQTLSFPSFFVTLNRIATFSNNRKVLWVNIVGEELLQLHKAIDSLLSLLFPKDSRFTPHLTLARTKALFSKEVVEKYQKQFLPERHEVHSIILYESRLQGAHHVHVPIHIYTLE